MPAIAPASAETSSEKSGSEIVRFSKARTRNVALIPLVLGAVGAGTTFTFPHVGFGVFVGYAIYGFTLGGFFGLAVQALSKRVVAEEIAATG